MQREFELPEVSQHILTHRGLLVTSVHQGNHRAMESYEELSALTDAQVIAIFDQGRQNIDVGKQWYLDELTRRRADRATDALVVCLANGYLVWV